jgi:ABC-type dipeptide/oligopeptide/nickel transport system permease subunit
MECWSNAFKPHYSITPSLQGFLSWGLLIWVGYLLIITLFALTGGDLAPYDPTAQQVLARLLPPFSSSSRGLHWLGPISWAAISVEHDRWGALDFVYRPISNAIG